MKDHIIICGLGQIGFRTFELLARANKKITIISNKTSDDLRWQIEEAGCVFLLGDARNDKLLIKAGIEHATCILALTDQDMVNVSIMMDARKLNPHIRIIARMLDTDLGRHIAEAFDVHQVFSPSELAAPIFSSGIHKESALAQFTIDDTTYVVSENTHTPRNTTDETSFIIATENENDLIATSVTKLKKPKKPISKFRRIVNKVIDKITYFRSPVLANFRRFLGVLVCVIIFATLFLAWQMNLHLIDALYFVTTTVTTVGYGDFNFSQSSHAMKLFGCLLMLSGAAALAVLFSSITEIILSKKLQNLFGGRLVPKGQHVVVVGAKHLGSRVIMDLLDEDIPVVVMEDETTGQYSIDLKRHIAVIDGNPRNDETLRRAGIRHANVIMTLMDDDVENLGVSLAAKKINPSIMTIAQIFDSRLGSKLQEEMRITRVLSMSNVAAPYFAAAVFGEKILLALTWHEKLIFISQGGHDTLNHPMHKDLQIRHIALDGMKLM